MRPLGPNDLRELHQEENYSQDSSDKEKVPGFNPKAKKEQSERNMGLRKTGIAETACKTQTMQKAEG